MQQSTVTNRVNRPYCCWCCSVAFSSCSVPFWLMGWLTRLIKHRQHNTLSYRPICQNAKMPTTKTSHATMRGNSTSAEMKMSLQLSSWIIKYNPILYVYDMIFNCVLYDTHSLALSCSTVYYIEILHKIYWHTPLCKVTIYTHNITQKKTDKRIPFNSVLLLNLQLFVWHVPKWISTDFDCV